MLPANAQSRESLAGVCSAEVGTSRRRAPETLLVASARVSAVLAAFSRNKRRVTTSAEMLVDSCQLETNLQRQGHTLVFWKTLQQMLPASCALSLGKGETLECDLPGGPRTDASAGASTSAPRGSSATRPC